MTRKQHIRNILIILVIALIGGTWYMFTPNKAQLDIAKLQGIDPNLSKLKVEGFPSVAIADVKGWAKGAAPTPASGMGVTEFAGGLDHPRWLYTLPNGDILVAESTQPSRETEGFQDWVARNLIMKANASSVSANRISVLRDADGDGVAEMKTALIEGLNSPFGMALIGDELFVANTDSVMAFPFTPGDTKITAKGRKIMDLPSGVPNNHWTRNLAYDPKENMLYVTIGSNSNIGENGMESEKDRAQIKQYNLKTGETLLYAYGLRNPTGLAFNPISETLWTTVNERDMLGPDGPPDYLTTVDFGTFYGWPYYFWGQNEDGRVKQTRMDLKQYSKRPDYALGPHVAALGLAFSRDAALGASYANGAFVAMHGSWNRSPKSGYKVVYIPFNERGFPVRGVKPVPVLTGFLSKDEDVAYGRPAGLAMDKGGALLVADDSGNKVWRVSAKGG